MHLRLFLTILVVCVFPLGAQETRSAIDGHVYDQLSAVVDGAKVLVTNLDNGATVSLTTNHTGYFEAPLMLPGSYRISAAMDGFKTAVRTGIVLSVGGHLSIDLRLDLGSVAETVTVTGETSMLDPASIEVGTLIDNKTLMELPVMGNNPTLLAKLMPGMQTDGVNNYLGLHSIAGGSAYNNAGGVGGNEWSIDGVPNNGGSRQAAYLPYSDAVAEFRIDTMGFDVTQGRGTGASVMAMTKSGSNQWHGTVTEQHWQQRLNATPYFSRQLYFRKIADARAAGNIALANQLAS